MDADLGLEGAKIQFAKVFGSFMVHALKGPPSEEAKRGEVGELEATPVQQQIVNQYAQFFVAAQNKEVLHMALDHVSDVILKMQEADEHGICARAAEYFDQTFKRPFFKLEKSIHNNWRLHKAFYEALGSLCLTTGDRAEAKEIVTMMLGTVKSKTCSMPVKREITERLARLITTR